tara:strand:+ start:262 stop:1764 length:1503 start_codon:yes stop_codon:yes gene_type:complete
MKNYQKHDKELINALNKKGLDYLPYKFSLEEKLNIASNLKDITNKNFPIDCNFNQKKIKGNYLLSDLKKNGITQFKNPLLTKKQIADINFFLKSEKAYPAHVPYYDKFHPIKNIFNFKGKIASFNADSIIRAPHLIELITRDDILDVIRNYLGCNPTLFDLNLICSFGSKEKYHETHHFHRDHDDFHHVLLMIYLSDVYDNSGGHIYAQKSHLIDNSSGQMKPKINENNSVKDRLSDLDDFKEEIIVGEAGTGFISDANGLHSGSVPEPNKRRFAFWARFGLGPNYMWEVHNHRYWGYEPKTFEKKIESRNPNKDFIFRLFTQSYDKFYYKNKITKGDECMKKTSIKGWNIVVYGKYYYALDQFQGTINIEELVTDIKDLYRIKRICKRKKIMVNLNEESLIRKVKKIGYTQPKLMEESFYKKYNIVALRNYYFGLPISETKLNRNIWKFLTKLNEYNLFGSWAINFVILLTTIKNEKNNIVISKDINKLKFCIEKKLSL